MGFDGVAQALVAGLRVLMADDVAGFVNQQFHDDFAFDPFCLVVFGIAHLLPHFGAVEQIGVIVNVLKLFDGKCSVKIQHLGLATEANDSLFRVRGTGQLGF